MELRSGFLLPPSFVSKQPLRSYQKEILAVLKSQKKAQSLSVRAISRFIESRFKVASSFANSLKAALERGIEEGWLDFHGNKYSLPKSDPDDVGTVKKVITPAAKVVRSVIAKAKSKASEVSKTKRAAIVKKYRPIVSFDSPAGSAPVSPRASSPAAPAVLPAFSAASVPRASPADEIDPERKAKIINSFLPPQSGPQTNIEILFSFDTTGSMSSCIGEVRKKISETVTRLLEDVPGIRIAIVAHGDYCDGANMISSLDFSSDKPKIVQFVNGVSGTGGGDFPEAYEVVLKRSQALTWTPHFSKAIVMIGDATPHEANDPQNIERIDWREECRKLKGGNVKVYAVQCQKNAEATKFFAQLAELTDGCHLELNEFRAITDMFLGVCYREAAEFQLQRHPEALADLGDGEDARIMRPEVLGGGGGVKFTDAEMLAIHTAIHSGSASVQIGGASHTISIGNSGCRFVRVDGVTFIEQNKEKDSRYARMAWEGRKITWLTRQGQWGLIMDGEVVRH